MIWILPQAPTPDTTKPFERDVHFCHAPFKRLFFCRSLYNSSCSRLMWPTNLAPLPPASVLAVSLGRSSEDDGPLIFLDRASSLEERSVTTRDFCCSSSWSLFRYCVFASSWATNRRSS